MLFASDHKKLLLKKFLIKPWLTKKAPLGFAVFGYYLKVNLLDVLIVDLSRDSAFFFPSCFCVAFEKLLWFVGLVISYIHFTGGLVSRSCESKNGVIARYVMEKIAPVPRM